MKRKQLGAEFGQRERLLQQTGKQPYTVQMSPRLHCQTPQGTPNPHNNTQTDLP